MNDEITAKTLRARMARKKRADRSAKVVAQKILRSDGSKQITFNDYAIKKIDFDYKRQEIYNRNMRSFNQEVKASSELHKQRQRRNQ